MKKIIGSVNIAGKKYKIDAVKDQKFIVDVSGVEGAVGCCSTMMQQIYVLQNDETHEDFVIDTMLHEILHAVQYHYILKEQPDDETLVVLLTTALTQLIKDNPKLVELLSGNKKEEGKVARVSKRKNNQAEPSSPEP